jgi:tetratricopeptide (TPR) repeat protein
LAAECFRRAIDRDSDYASAYWALGGALGNIGDQKESIQNIRRAYDLRDHVTPRQRFLVDFQYFTLVTADLEKGVNVLQEAIKTYPNTETLHVLLAWALNNLGRYEDGAAEAREALRLDPDNVSPYYHLIRAETAMQHYEEAKVTFDAARARGLDYEGIRSYMCQLAFVEGDGALLRQQISWLLEHAKSSDMTWEVQGDIAAYQGQMKDARRFFSEGATAATRSGFPEIAVGLLSEEAMREAWVGNHDLAKQAATQALTLTAGSQETSGAAFAFALAGELKTAEKMAEQLDREQPHNTIVQNFDLPCIRAVIAIGKGNSSEAIRLLQSTRYDLAQGDLALSPMYIRGLAYLEAGRTQEAADEFQKVINHPGTGANKLSPWGAAAHVQLARAQAIIGDKAAARKSYQYFLNLWKQADPDIPIYKQAKSEYAKLT